MNNSCLVTFDTDNPFLKTNEVPELQNRLEACTDFEYSSDFARVCCSPGRGWLYSTSGLLFLTLIVTQWVENRLVNGFVVGARMVVFTISNVFILNFGSQVDSTQACDISNDVK
jgi:hypothetical protein